MRILLAALLLSAGALSGCLLEPTCATPLPPALAPLLVEGDYLHTDPEQAWETLVLRNATEAEGDWRLSTRAEKAGWTSTLETLTPEAPADGLALQLVRVTPGAGSSRVLVSGWSETAIEGYCSTGRGDSVAYDLAEPRAGTSAHAGQGVHVMTAGFWENGTLFYTNIPAIDQDPAWPKAEWYAWEGDDPLPVYVYDQDRGEESALWHGTTAGTPLGPPTMNLTLWDYFTTIPGFNDALKGLSTGTSRVARLSPEQAYTRAGNEDHPLYGDAIVFYIKVLDVVDLPCPAATNPALCNVPLVARSSEPVHPLA